MSGCVVSLATVQLCPCSTQTPISKMSTDELYSNKAFFMDTEICSIADLQA